MNNEKSIETIKLFSKIISKNYATLVEKSINDFSIEYSEYYETPFLLEEIYNDKVSEIYNALVKTPDLIKNDEDAIFIAKLNPAELNPENYESILKKKEFEEYKKTDLKSSSAFKCPKCKKSRTTVTQKQTRSGYEPATIFVTCLECDYNYCLN